MNERIIDQGQGKDADNKVALGMLLGMTAGLSQRPPRSLETSEVWLSSEWGESACNEVATGGN